MTHVRTIISGGQTGAHRAVLDFAIESVWKHGGWCPRGRKAEDGSVPAKYLLVETELANDRVRTVRNVTDSDAILILNMESWQHYHRAATNTVDPSLHATSREL